GEGERDTELGIEARLGRDRARVRAAQRRQDVLGRGLAHGAGDADDPSARQRAHRAADRGERAVRVARDQDGGRPAREGVVAEVGAGPDGNEAVALLDAARVDVDAGDLVGPAGPRQPPETLELVERERDQADTWWGSARIASRATSRSSNGSMRPAVSCPCSSPLPARTTMSPGAAISIARRMASRRSRMRSSSPGAPAATSSAIA